MAYKLIACDLDETLLGRTRKVSARNRAAIRRAGEQGVKFVPATGRGFYSIRGTLKELDLLGKAEEYAITYNGGAIVENQGERLLHYEGLPFETAEELFRRGLGYDVCIHVYTKDAVYAYRMTENETAYLAGRMEIEEIFTPNLDRFREDGVAKMLFVNTDFAYLKQIENDLQDIAAGLDISFSSNRYIEFNRKGVSKGAGLLALANQLGIPPEETIAIGDNFNDLSMIQAAGLGVGVRNTIPEMQPLCDVLTDATCEEDAVAEVIEKYVLGG